MKSFIGALLLLTTISAMADDAIVFNTKEKTAVVNGKKMDIKNGMTCTLTYYYMLDQGPNAPYTVKHYRDFQGNATEVKEYKMVEYSKPKVSDCQPNPEKPAKTISIEIDTEGKVGTRSKLEPVYINY